MKRHSPIVASTPPTFGGSSAISAAVAEVEPPPLPDQPLVVGRGNPNPNSQAEVRPKSGLKKVSFGAGLLKKTDTKTAYPVMPAVRDSAAVVDRIIERTAQLDALTGALETDKAELKSMALPHYFSVNHGRHEVPSSIACHGTAVAGRAPAEVLVNFQNRYTMLPDESALLPILGDNLDNYFRQSFLLKINGDKLPEENTQKLMDELQALFAKYGATDAIEVKEGVKPVAEFHAARHIGLSVEQNLALDAVCPIIAMVKTKGRK
jgi:hypothetical protein